MARALLSLTVIALLQIGLPTLVAYWQGRRGGDFHRWQSLGCRLWISFVFVAIGFGHFINPAFVAELLPPFIPFPYLMSYLSGAAEILMVVGLWSSQQRWAGLVMIAWLAAILPFNIYGWTIPGAGRMNPNFETSPYYLVLRIPLQAIWIYLVYVASGQSWRENFWPRTRATA